MRLDRRKFETWLRSKPADEVVGVHRSCEQCPILNFYKEASGGCEAMISDNEGFPVIDRGDGHRRLPAWAEAFVFEVDSEPLQQITAARALSILSTISK